MNLTLSHPLRRRYMNADLDSGGTDTGGDRGDSFTPTADPAPIAKTGEEGKPGDGEAAAAALLQKEIDDAAAAKLEEGDDKEDKDDKGEKKEAKKDSRIPLSRHEQILKREREARQGVERELAKYKQGTEVADLNKEINSAETELVTMETEYNKLIVDGDAKGAAALMTKIRAAERGIIETKSQVRETANNARIVENARYAVAMERIETEYPQLNPDHDDFDEAVYGEVAELLTGYKAQGYTPTEALQKAVRKELGAKTAAEKKVLDTTPRVDAKAIAEQRTKEAREKTAKAVEGTPASTAKVGMDSDKAGGGLNAKAVMTMSQDAFAKLPDDALARLRGDEL
jgi:hypothetical protein